MKTRVFWLSAALALAACGTAWSQCQVWTTTESVRVLREDSAGAGRAVKLAAAKNEWESFQVFLRSTTPVRIERVDLLEPDGAVVPAENVRLYREHQFHITIPTIRNDGFRPGWYPDPLIPFSHPLTGKPLSGARLTALPFDLPANETHGFWIDLFVPADARPGVYQGACRITANPPIAAQIPVELTVWDFALPETPTLQTALGSPAERLRPYYAGRAKSGKESEPTDWEAVDGQVARMLSENRINASAPVELLTPEAQPDGSFAIAKEKIDALRQFIDRYHVNAVEVPHPRRAVRDPEAEREKLRAWLASLDQAIAELDRPGVTFFFYLRDEPNDKEAYQYIQQWGRAVREARSAVKVMVVEQTKTQDSSWGDLYGAVDIWCSLFPLFDPETAATRQALSETMWAYTALCQRDKTPWWHTDYPLLNYRVPAWISWRYRIRGLLYWGGMTFWSDVDDPWTEPWTLDRRDRSPNQIYNGEGSLLYPGRAVGYDGIAPSMRLKALRDSIEDYEYLALLERAGKAAEAEKIVLPLAGSWFKWDLDPKAYEGARSRLAELILSAKSRGD